MKEDVNVIESSQIRRLSSTDKAVSRRLLHIQAFRHSSERSNKTDVPFRTDDSNTRLSLISIFMLSVLFLRSHASSRTERWRLLSLKESMHVLMSHHLPIMAQSWFGFNLKFARRRAAHISRCLQSASREAEGIIGNLSSSISCTCLISYAIVLHHLVLHQDCCRGFSLLCGANAAWHTRFYSSPPCLERLNRRCPTVDYTINVVSVSFPLQMCIASCCKY